LFTGFETGSPQPAYYLLVHNRNASMWMRNFWNNHIDKVMSIAFDQEHGQTSWLFHLKTNNLDISHTNALNIRPSVSIQSMHFVFPFCPIEVGYIVIPISKQTWETEATLLSDFSRFLPLKVEASLMNSGISKPQSLFDFFNIKFTLRARFPRSTLVDRGLAEFIFPNTSFIPNYGKTCFCCEVNLIYNQSLGKIERLERVNPYNYELPLLILNEYVHQILLATQTDEYTFLSCGDSYHDPPDFSALFIPFSKPTWALIFITIFGWPLILSHRKRFQLENCFKGF